MEEEEHGFDCEIWEYTFEDWEVNPVRPCTCGLRRRQAEQRAQVMARYRRLEPLNMSDDDFLRTLRIKPS